MTFIPSHKMSLAIIKNVIPSATILLSIVLVMIVLSPSNIPMIFPFIQGLDLVSTMNFFHTSLPIPIHIQELCRILICAKSMKFIDSIVHVIGNIVGEIIQHVMTPCKKCILLPFEKNSSFKK